MTAYEVVAKPVAKPVCTKSVYLGMSSGGIVAVIVACCWCGSSGCLKEQAWDGLSGVQRCEECPKDSGS